MSEIFCMGEEAKDKAMREENLVRAMEAEYIKIYYRQGSFPKDCNGKQIKASSVVYLPNGWHGDKPNPWKKAYVVGLSIINGVYYLELEGCETYRVIASVVSVVQPYPKNDA
jgi:hypothetical protein